MSEPRDRTTWPDGPIAFRPGDLAPQLEARGGRSGSIARRDLARYYTILDDELRRQTWTPREAELLVRVLGTGAPQMPAQLLWAHVDDTLRDADGRVRAAVVAKVRALTLAGCLALLDACERFAALERKQPLAQRLATAGLVHRHEPERQEQPKRRAHG